MAKKRRPILTALIILSIIAVILGTTMMIALKMFGVSSPFQFSEKIGVIPIEGPIYDSPTITSQLVEFQKDTGIKAIILRIDSPGGAVGPSQEIYKEVKRTAQTKKVIASFGTVAASGGYYVAAASDKIVANPGTITGSIGVLMEFVRMEDLLDKIGIDLEIMKSGEFKDIGAPNRKLTKRDREVIHTLIGDIQDQFVQAVATGRQLPLQKVKEIADGRIFSGARAKELGLVDALGNFQDAVALTKDVAEIKGDVTLVYAKKKRGGLWDLLFDAGAKAVTRILRGPASRIEYRWDGFSGVR